MAHKFKTFDSPEDYVAALEKVPQKYRDFNSTSFLGDTFAGALNTLRTGDYFKTETRVQALVDQLNTDGMFTTGVPLPTNAYWGNRVNIAAFVADKPRTMTRRIQSEDSSLNAPISIYAETNVSLAVSKSEIEDKGVTVAALVLALATMRPVDVYAVSTRIVSHDFFSGVCTKISSRYIDTGRLCFALTSPAYARALGHSMGAYIGNFDPATGRGVVHSQTEIATVKNILGLGPQDVYIPGGSLYDPSSYRSPLKWIEAKLEEYRHIV